MYGFVRFYKLQLAFVCKLLSYPLLPQGEQRSRFRLFLGFRL